MQANERDSRGAQPPRFPRGSQNSNDSHDSHDLTKVPMASHDKFGIGAIVLALVAGIVASCQVQLPHAAERGAATVLSGSTGPNGTRTHIVTFRGGEPAAIWLIGAGETNLDLVVFDEHGNAVCRRTGASDREQCFFHPRWTGVFRIEVRNLGAAANGYTLRLR